MNLLLSLNINLVKNIITQLTKTPPILYELPESPKAPRKVKSQIRRGSLQPKKLTFERDNSKKIKEKPTFTVWEDKDCNNESVIRPPAVTSSSIRTTEADKENRPDSITQRKKVKSNSREGRLHDRGRKGLEFDLRRLRI